MPTIKIDCAAVRTEAEFWQLYIDVVRPQGANIFGRNLDAFDDALSGGPGWPGELQLQFRNTSELRALRGGEFLGALTEIAVEHPSVTLS